jgi:NADH dehydrogenase FAD-containing subunit
MGNSHTEKKHLVVIGASFAGLSLVEDLKNDFMITIIEKKDHFEWKPAMPKSMLNPE